MQNEQSIKKAGDKWNTSAGNSYEHLNNHLGDVSVKLEERHQKMTLLMRPIDDETDTGMERGTLNDYRKTKSGTGQKKAEMDRHIAFRVYY